MPRSMGWSIISKKSVSEVLMMITEIYEDFTETTTHTEVQCVQREVEEQKIN